MEQDFGKPTTEDFSLALSPKTSPVELTRLAKSLDQKLRYLVAMNPSTPENVVQELRAAGAFAWVLQGKSASARSWIALSAQTHPFILEQLAKDKSNRVRHSLSSNERCLTETIDFLAKSKSPYTSPTSFQNLLKRRTKLFDEDNFCEYQVLRAHAIVEVFCHVSQLWNKKFDGEKIISQFRRNLSQLDSLGRLVYAISVWDYLDVWLGMSYGPNRSFSVAVSTTIEIIDLLNYATVEALKSEESNISEFRQCFNAKDMLQLKHRIRSCSVVSLFRAMDLGVTDFQETYYNYTESLQMVKGNKLGFQGCSIETIRAIAPLELWNDEDSF